MKNELYRHYASLEDIGGEYGRVHMNLVKLELDVNKKVDISYSLTEGVNGYKDEKVSFIELKNMLMNQEGFLDLVFFIDIVEEDFGIRISGGELWVASFDKRIADFIFNVLRSM